MAVPSRQSISAQGMALAQRTDGEIGVLRPRHFTPNEAAVRAGGLRMLRTPQAAHHEPVSIALAAQQKTALANEARATLDGFMLLEACGMALPDDARQASLPDRSIGAVVEEDLQFFTGLLVLDVSENHLALAPFGTLPRLKELRIACNSIHTIEDLYGFDHLMYLDISYNKLTLRSVQALDVLPNLKDIDLSGNNLRGLPFEMYRFRSLERLVIDNNKIDDNNIFSILCTVPNLRYLSAAYNYLYKFSPECCAEGYFRLLTTLDVSFNYFGNEGDVQPISELPRLTTVMLFGNPVLGPKGEDPTYIYIEELVNTAADIRRGARRQEIDWVTEVPRSRVLKKGVPAGRKATYRDFSIVQVEPELSATAAGAGAQQRTGGEWRAAGNQSLFAEAIALARKEQLNARENDFTFLTSVNARSAEEEHARKVADGVMDKVAGEMGLSTSAEILHMRDLAALSRTVAGAEEDKERLRAAVGGATEGRGCANFLLTRNNAMFGGGGDDEEEDAAAAAALADSPEDNVPSTLFGRSMGNPQTLTTYPVEVRTAMRALQFALRHPLTNYNEVPAKGLLPPKDYVRPTLSSMHRKLPRRKEAAQKQQSAAISEDLQAKRDAAKGLPEPTVRAQKRQEARENTLAQIEEVLDNLNKRTDNLLTTKGGHGTAAEQLDAARGFARPANDSLKNLVQMVEEVVHSLDG